MNACIFPPGFTISVPSLKGLNFQCCHEEHGLRGLLGSFVLSTIQVRSISFFFFTLDDFRESGVGCGPKKKKVGMARGYTWGRPSFSSTSESLSTTR